jgi:hypothetical protein
MNTEAKAKLRPIMDPIREEISDLMTEINELYYKRRNIVSNPVPVKRTGFFGTTQKNKNKAAAETKARLAEVDKTEAELIANLQTLYSNLIEAIPKETKEILDKHKFTLIKRNNEDPYYIKKNTNREIGKYGSGAPIIERDTMILINSDIVDKVDEFDKYQKAMNDKKIQNETTAKNAEDKKEKDDLLIKRYEKIGYTYKPNEQKQYEQTNYFALIQGAPKYSYEKIPPFLEYELKSYSVIPGWTKGIEATKVTSYDSPSSHWQGYSQYNEPKEHIQDIPIWTRELPTGFPQRIVVGSNEFYDIIKKIEASEAPKGGKRSKRKTLKKKKRSGKKLN